MVLDMTEAAGNYLTAVLDAAEVSEHTAVRIRLQDDGLAPTLDMARPGDERFQHHGRVVLVLDDRAREYLEGSMLDVEHTPDGPKLLILQ